MATPATTTVKKSPAMRALTARLKGIQLSFNDIWQFVQKFKESNTITEVQIRLGKLDELWEAFSGTLVEIFSHDDYDAEGNAFEKERMEFSDRYYEAKSFLMDKTRELQASQVLEQSSSAGDSSMRNGTDHVRLPQIQLQTFNGNIDEWLSFRDLFSSLIHWKEYLPEVEKFHYLKGCLQGEPKSLIDPLQITKANYQVAWDLLLKRYNNSKLLKKRQVISLFKLPMLSKESAMELNALVEGFERIIQTLDQVVQLADFKDLLLVNILTVRLDPVTRRGGGDVGITFCSNSAAPTAAKTMSVDEQGNLQFISSVWRTLSSLLVEPPSLPMAGRMAKDCQSKYSCRNCKSRHHTLVCFKPERNRDAKVSAASRADKPAMQNESSQVANLAATNVFVLGAEHQYSAKVLLATAVVIIEDDNRWIGSESNFVTERLSQRLKVTVNLPTSNINTERWEIPNGVQLADPTFFESKAVDLVLGIEAFFDFFETGRRISLGQHMPTLSESVFGWVACGGHTHQTQSLQIKCNLSAVDSLDKLITRFWSCEEIESGKALSLEEKRCEELFSQTVKRNPDGRYTVSLPKDEAILSRLGESRDIAFRRLQGTERRLARDESLHEQYTNFMQEYLQLGHMRKVEEAEVETIKRCYLPHHPVVKESSTTTKVRVVFDASCKTTSGESLNDLLLVGPVIQEDLRSIILRSRTKQIMLVSDVEKMFRKIKVCQEDRPLQCILWRSSPIHDIDTYELNTVTYGTKPAPFLATRTLKQLAVDEEDNFPFAARAIMEDTYMDDVITGSDDPESARTLRVQLNSMTKKGGFRLRKWVSNCSDALSGIPKEELAIQSSEKINLDPDPSIETLGLTWMPVTDTLKFQFKIPILNPSVPLTKRKILSVIATLFDPLGLLGAAITSAKIYMQLLWTLRDENGQRLNWDQSLPSTVGEVWIKYHQRLSLLNTIRIERCVVIPKAVSIQFHCFSDASKKAYGACLYVKSWNSNGEVWVRLLTSKSRVAPLQVQTIPRLELCGARLAAQLFEKVSRSIKFTAPVYFWTDSTCVLRWIRATPATWTTYVSNRVATIQSLTEISQWNHVPGIHNPADLISRGIAPEDIVHNRFWWQGPQWLAKEKDEWPRFPETSLAAEEEAEEKRRTVYAGTVSSITEFNNAYLTRFSSYTDLIRRTAYWLRLKRLLRTKKKKDASFLSTKELKEAETALISLVQQEVFAEERKALMKKEAVSIRSPLRWFNPYLSENQVIRLGGRLKHALESENVKHPVVLPASHYFTRLLLRYYHERLLHAGPQLLLSVVRLKFWPLGGRSVVRHIIHRCMTCYRTKPTTVQQMMGDLPTARVTVSRPFLRTGVDYFGPIYVRPAPRRPVVKAYVAIFVCMCTKAVHLELVTDLSTDKFLQALRRFVSRRGRCAEMFSDNGTNFVGARNKLQDFLKLLRNSKHHDIVSKELAEEGIQWHFNPPSAPHFGGLWEAAVRSAKTHLLKVVGENPVSPEDMTTLLPQVEACLNSCPLTPMFDDPNDLQPSTPAHFLVGESLQALPEPNLEDLPTNRLNHWQLMQRKLQDFWRRWRREFLCQLQGRTKRWKPAVTIGIGQLVLIQDDNQPPMRWKMGRIIQVHPGGDGTVRVVTLKTASGTLMRPVEKICILPIADNTELQDATADSHQS
ncbi:uncharacterized protein LOC129728925 [Wyeomyia smithii]|uniref:uncharacterized protein LOC129728925 n=1 Tax=Wyeomyia smithii TaxID=174621 RepID=UPI002467DEDC|nr:uncharacterized protein LOC129728925 [Wyeomyia smithii]